MIKAFALAAAALSFAGAVQAQTTNVSVTGDPVQVHRQITSAARSVCGAQFGYQPLAFYYVPSCVRATVKDAEDQLRAAAGRTR